MRNTFTAQELSDFYQKVEDGYIIECRPYNLALWKTQEEPNGPNLKCCKDNWRFKPTKKVIDPKLVDVRAAHEAAKAIALAKFAEECDAAFIDSLLATAKEQDNE